ncbi:MAG: iron complex outerrane recepter protein [Sphingomonadales bacterium]|nr:iron complex outerrane recepter protein [Sphingomonadales bacterium]
MIRKSAWLLSAALVAVPNAAFAQNNDTATKATTPSPTEQAAVAPQAQAAADAQGDQIIITAQGRRQILQDVPIAVTAVGGGEMKNSGASDIRQLNQLVPTLLVSSTGSEANGSARIRGIGTVGDNPGLESSVAVFIDGVYRSRSGIGLNELGEIDRVEVLRGPQGTLFGRNASAGLIHIITKKPTFTPSAYGEVTLGNYSLKRFAAGVNGPLSDTLAARVDAVYVKRDGFYTVVNPTGGTESSVNDRNRFFTRGQLLFQPSDALSVRLIGDVTLRDESCCGAAYVQTREVYDPTPGTPGDFATATSNRIVNILKLPYFGGIFPSAGDPYNRKLAISPGRTYKNKTHDWGGSGQIDYDLGGVNLTSITAYRFYKSYGAGDLDYGNVDLYFRDNDGNSYRQFKTFSQELRLQGSAFAKKLDWLIGGYFAHEDLRVSDNVRYGNQYGPFAACRALAGSAVAVTPLFPFFDPSAPGCMGTTPQPALGGATMRQAVGASLGAAAPTFLAALDRLSSIRNLGDINSKYYQTSKNYALFTHDIFHITDRLDATIGLRYTHESKDFSAKFNNNNTICPQQQAALGPFLTNPALAATAAGIIILSCTGNNTSALNALNLQNSFSEHKVTGTGVLSYKATDRLLLYASYSRGYKAGGYNLDRSDLRTAVSPPTNADAANLRFAPEVVDAVEAGFKFSRRGFLLNAALFYESFRDFQLNTFNGTVFIVQNVNSCSTKLNGTDQDQSATTGSCSPSNVRSGVSSKGLELESTWTPMRDLTLTAGYAYADTKYRHNLIGSSAGEPLDPALFLLPGQNLSNAPKHTVTGSVAITPPIGPGLTGLLYFDGRYTSKFNTGSDLFPEKLQKGFFVANARVGVRDSADRWAIELWAQNLFDTNYEQVAFNGPFQSSGPNNGTVAQVMRFGSPTSAIANQIYPAFLAEPRTVGVTLRARWTGERAVAPAYVPPPPPPPPPPATQTCPDGSVILATATCPAPPPPPPPPPPAPERGS